MYNWSEYSSNYSDTTGKLWFYSEDKETNFHADIRDNAAFKSLECKAKLLANTVAQSAPNQAN